MKCLFLMCITISIVEIKAQCLQGTVKKFFNRVFVVDSWEFHQQQCLNVTKTFERKWKPFAKMLESAISSAIKETFGYKNMNLYINSFTNTMRIAIGYYHNDNQIELILQYLFLQALPNLYDVDVSFPLASNLLMVKASVSKMILHAGYLLFRNHSEIVFGSKDQDPYKNSPFTFQQVRNNGHLAIVIEGCTLSGPVVVTLGGNTVNLGHHKLRLNECQYSIEIYKHGDEFPPVIANYWPKRDKGLNIDVLLLPPLVEELTTKLQAAVFSMVNTSALFNDDLPKFRSMQATLFENSRICLDKMVRNMNHNTIQRNMGTLMLDDFVISWDEKFSEMPRVYSLALSNMSLMGLDTVYASHLGGPVRWPDTKRTAIIEQLRFGTLQVLGNITVVGYESNKFAVEIEDFMLDVTIDKYDKITYEALGWRNLDFSSPSMEFMNVQSLVIGYLLKELPKVLKSHLSFTNKNVDTLYNKGYIQNIYSMEEEHAKDGVKYVDSEEIRNHVIDTSRWIESESPEEDYVEIGVYHEIGPNDADVSIDYVTAKPIRGTRTRIYEKNRPQYTSTRQGVRSISSSTFDTQSHKSNGTYSTKYIQKLHRNYLQSLDKKLCQTKLYDQTKNTYQINCN